MVQFECPMVILPLVPFTFGVHCGVSISLYAGKGKCCIWPVNKVEIHFAKIGLVDCKWPNLKTQCLKPLGMIHFWGPLGAVLFSACRKREIMHVTC